MLAPRSLFINQLGITIILSLLIPTGFVEDVGSFGCSGHCVYGPPNAPPLVSLFAAPPAVGVVAASVLLVQTAIYVAGLMYSQATVSVT